jgi:hypothetical protein
LLEELNGHFAVELTIAGAADDAHATLANHLAQFVTLSE